MMDNPNDKEGEENGPKVIIEGITVSGILFRPSDWAQRIGGSISTFKNHRIYYSPLLKPAYKEGYQCLVMDVALQQIHPALYKHIIDFAHKNTLKIYTMNEGDRK